MAGSAPFPSQRTGCLILPVLLAEGWESTSLNSEIGRLAKSCRPRRPGTPEPVLSLSRIWTFRPGIVENDQALFTFSSPALSLPLPLLRLLPGGANQFPGGVHTTVDHAFTAHGNLPGGVKVEDRLGHKGEGDGPPMPGRPPHTARPAPSSVSN